MIKRNFSRELLGYDLLGEVLPSWWVEYKKKFLTLKFIYDSHGQTFLSTLYVCLRETEVRRLLKASRSCFLTHVETNEQLEQLFLESKLGFRFDREQCVPSDARSARINANRGFQRVNARGLGPLRITLDVFYNYCSTAEIYRAALQFANCSDTAAQRFCLGS